MIKNIAKTLIILIALFLLNNIFAIKVNAASCAFVPISGNYTVSASCTFANTVDGVDAGSGTVNTAVLTVNLGQTLTVNSGQTIGFGSITNNGTILLNTNKTAVLKNAPIWMIDADSDGYPSSTTEYVQGSAPANGRRRNLLTTVTAADCNDADATKYQNLTGYNDLDGDTYTSGTTQVCSGASLPAYNQTTSPYRSAPSATADCYDVNSTGGANAHPGQIAFFTVNRGDGSFDYNCDGAANGITVGQKLGFTTGCVANSAGTLNTQSTTGTCPSPFSPSSNTSQIGGCPPTTCDGQVFYTPGGCGTVSSHTCINATTSTQYQ